MLDCVFKCRGVKTDMDSRVVNDTNDWAVGLWATHIMRCSCSSESALLVWKREDHACNA